MKNMLILGVLAVILFGVSAGVSWYLQHLNQSPSEAENNSGANAASSRPPAPAQQPPSAPPPRAVPSSPPNAQADEAAQWAARLRTQEENLKKREKQLDDRKKHVDLIFEQIRKERTEIEELRKQLQDEIKAASDKVGELDRKVEEADRRHSDAEKRMEESNRRVTEIAGLEQGNIKHLASIYDTMPADRAGKILETMANSGNLDVAVKILGTMKERQAARVLAELNDPALAGQLLEKLTGLQKSNPNQPKK